jgi:hypothetical protein
MSEDLIQFYIDNTNDIYFFTNKSNIIPICAQFNLSMGMKNMYEFMRCFEKNEI